MNRKLISVFLLSVSTTGFLVSSSFLGWELFIKKTTPDGNAPDGSEIPNNSEEWAKIDNSPTNFLNSYDLTNFLPAILDNSDLPDIQINKKNFEYLYLKEFFTKFDIPKTTVDIGFDYPQPDLARVNVKYKVNDEEYSVTKEYLFKPKN